MKNTLLILFLSISACVNAQYDINDPRNPNCPCHKYQKIADEEYKKLLAKANDNSVRQVAIKDNNGTIDKPGVEKPGVNRIKKRKNAGFILKRKHLQKRAKTNKHKKLFGRKKSNNDCFSWK